MCPLPFRNDKSVFHPESFLQGLHRPCVKGGDSGGFRVDVVRNILSPQQHKDYYQTINPTNGVLRVS